MACADLKMERHNKANFFVAAACFVCVALLFSGCAMMRSQPKVQLPGDLPTTWSAEVIIDRLPITASLLELIHEKQVRELVKEALANNPNLIATALRLKAEGYLLSNTRSRLLPRLNTEISKERNNQGVDTETGIRTTKNAHRLSLGISWEIDLWGRLADEHAASRHTVLAQENDYLHVRDALAVRVIQTWIEQVAIRRSLAVGEERIDVLQRIENILVERFKDGIGSLDDFSTAKSRTEIARAGLSEQKVALLRAVRLLEVLLGRYPRGELMSSGNLPLVTSPPGSLPATVLLNRPDVRAALARVESARYLSCAAQKAILPELRLSGQLFKEAARLNNIGGTTVYWSLLGSLFQPLFEGGRIMNESRARRTEAKASLMVLREVVLQALKEVEDAFHREHELAEQVRSLKIAVRESEKSSLNFEERYRQGLNGIQSLLIAKEQEMVVRIRLNEIIAEQLKNRIDLALALGVGLNNEGVLPTGDMMQ